MAQRPITDDEQKRIAELEKQVELLLDLHKDLGDERIRRALMEVAQSYVWREGLFERFKFAVNVIGMLGLTGGAVIAVLTVLGIEITRR
jgi:hypothetical protein